MTVGMKIILKLTVKVKEIEEHVSHEGKRQKTAGRVKRQMIKERTTKNTEEKKG